MQILTQKILTDAGAPAFIIQSFNRFYSPKAEVNADAFIQKLIQKELFEDAYYILDKFVTSNDEYTSIIKDYFLIDNSTNVYQSFNVRNSRNVVHSEGIENSKYVFYSGRVSNSISVHTSVAIESSASVFDSLTVTSSTQVSGSTGIDLSANVLESNFIIKGCSVANSNEATCCNSICFCDNVSNVYFSSFCKNLKDSFFCWGKSGDHLLFNKPYNPEQFTTLKKQYEMLIQPLHFIDWPAENTIITTGIPNMPTNRAKYYEVQRDEFWNWVKKLPNYDPAILYSITNIKSY